MCVPGVGVAGGLCVFLEWVSLGGCVSLEVVCVSGGLCVHGVGVPRGSGCP